jgi:hypothetical protein
MQAGVTIILYGYMDMNTINKGKRDEIIKNCYWKLICKQKVKKKKGRGVIPCHERLCNALARVSMIVM